MAHVIEPAASGRSKCRGCGERIAKDELRFGERLPNPFADEGDMTLWFHLECAAYKRPEPLLETITDAEVELPRREWFIEQAQLGLDHRRLPRVSGAERASSGRAACRHCREVIPKGGWRIRIAYYEDGRFSPGGFVHTACARDYFGEVELEARLRRFSDEWSEEETVELRNSLG